MSDMAVGWRIATCSLGCVHYKIRYRMPDPRSQTYGACGQSYQNKAYEQMHRKNISEMTCIQAKVIWPPKHASCTDKIRLNYVQHQPRTYTSHE